MSLVNLAVFDEDETLQKEGTPIYPLQGEDLFFCVPRVGGFLYQKQIQDIIKTKYGIYHEQSDIDMNAVHAIWLGEYVTDFGGADDKANNEELTFSRKGCRNIFNNEGYQQSLVSILINKASSFEYYLTNEGREAIEELKKR